MFVACEKPSGAGLSMTEQVPEDLTGADVADRPEADRSQDEGDTASEVDRWDDEGGHDRASEPCLLPAASSYRGAAHERPGPDCGFRAAPATGRAR